MKNIIITPVVCGNTTTRLSGMELLRIIAMFLVLVVHSCFFSLGAPDEADIMTYPLSSFTRILFQSLSIGCVDLFVLLSGWFGIRPKLKSISRFIFQCLFFLIGIYLFILFGGLTSLNIKGIAGCLLLLKWNWFIKAYLLLYLLSPVINAYIESTSRKQFKMILVFFFLFQTIYSWLSDAAVFFEKGYSTISFIGLYMLARYAAKYKSAIFNHRKHIYLLFFVLTIISMAVLYYLTAYYHLSFLKSRILRYDQPLVILSALSLVVYFSKLTFRSKTVNWIAASSFAVFLLHTNPNICEPYFVPAIRFLFNNYNGISCILSIFFFLAAIYFAAVGIDQLRKYLWNIIEPRIIR